MPFSERPPLDDYICEKIDAELYAVDTYHWPLIAAMRVPNYHPLDVPVPPPRREHLRYQIEWYAQRLYRAEADKYVDFRLDPRYVTWLSLLETRILTRVMTALDRIEEGDPDSMILGYHGLERGSLGNHLNSVLWGIRESYVQRNTTNEHDVPEVLPPPENPKSPNLPTRESLAEQIKMLKDECDVTAEEIAEALKIDPRSVFKHLAGDTMPRRAQRASYEKFFSDRLGRSVTLQKVRVRASKGHSKGI